MARSLLGRYGVFSIQAVQWQLLVPEIRSTLIIMLLVIFRV